METEQEFIDYYYKLDGTPKDVLKALYKIKKDLGIRSKQ